MADKAKQSVYACIAAVAGDLSQEGIAKTRKNEQQGYRFRGIDEVLNALSPLLAKHGLVILPRVVERSVSERATKTGGVLFYVVVEVEFDFVSAADGSAHTVRTLGEAMDSADKATNKAMSAAYKYAAFLTFCIPLEGTPSEDADTTTHDVVPLGTSAGVALDKPPGFDAWFKALEQSVEGGSSALNKTWHGTTEACRDYLAKTNAARITGLKAAARAVTDLANAKARAAAAAPPPVTTTELPPPTDTPAKPKVAGAAA